MRTLASILYGANASACVWDGAMQGARSGLAMGGKVIFKQALLYILNLIDHPSNEQEWPAGTPFKVLLINATCVTASVTVSTKRVAQGGFDPPSSRLWAWHANHCATELGWLTIEVKPIYIIC